MDSGNKSRTPQEFKKNDLAQYKGTWLIRKCQFVFLRGKIGKKHCFSWYKSHFKKCFTISNFNSKIYNILFSVRVLDTYFCQS